MNYFPSLAKLNFNVKFKDNRGLIASMNMNPREITKLISPIDGQFFSEMTFDDYPFEVYKYEINPLKKTLTIHVRPLKEDSKIDKFQMTFHSMGNFRLLVCAPLSTDELGFTI